MRLELFSKIVLVSCLLNIQCDNSLQAQSNNYRLVIPVNELQKDFEVLKTALKNYHPGLYRYEDSLTIEKYFTELQNELTKEMSSTQLYLTLSRFTAKLKCGHTFCSYFNQSGSIKDSIFNRKDKVPFTFFLYGKRIFIDKNLSETNLSEGSEIISINNIPVASIIDSLMPYLKGDGNNNGKRLIDLELSGLGKYEAFDIFFPLLFSPNNSMYEIAFKPKDKNEIQKLNASCITRAERFALMEQKYGKQPATLDDLWSFKILNENTAYLKLGTFVTNKLTIDWKKFLGNSFDNIKFKNISNLIIDIRGNEGGDDEVNLVLGKYLASKPIAFPEFKQLLRYEKVSDDIRPYLNTWDKSFYDRGGKLINLNNGFYTWKKSRDNEVISQNKNAFTGKTFLLVNAANSSATFFLTGGLQQNKIATIIGSETGGNRKGTNGGQLFFLWLPNSKIEIDIPLIGYYPLTEQPDRGLSPDIIVIPTLDDILNKKDKELERAFEIINQK